MTYPEKTNTLEFSVLRKRAESVKLETPGVPAKKIKLSPEDARKTLHELHVHKIELEMQNQELRKTQLELETARARYFNLYNMAPAGYCTVNEKGLITEANLAAATLLGISQGSLVSQPISHFVFKEDQDIYYLHSRQLVEPGKSQTCELRMLKKDGTPFCAHLKTSTANDEKGKPVSLIILSDSTEQKRMEEILKRDKKTLQKLIEARSDELIKIHAELERSKRLSDIGFLAATVAHELRNPLAGISLAAAIIRKKTANDITRRQLERIDKMLEESFQIIDSLLFYSRLKSPQHKKISVHSLLEDCIDTMQELRINKKIAVSKDIDSLKDNLISADPSQIKGVFTNILNNAADAVPDRTGKIEVKAKVYHELIKIHIADNGNGIAKSDLKKVFEPFFTTKAKGTGLGLTVSKHIVKMHGGFINIKSHKGKGTSAIITLPIEEPEKVIK
jgi:two-component system cell cycle sensor histidine kinase/response regulator CckA